MHRVLVVEDTPTLREAICTLLETEGLYVVGVGSAEAAIKELDNGPWSCILSDFKLPEKNGIDLLEEVRLRHADLPFVIMTAYGTIEIAVEAMRKGASDFVCKPIEPTRLASVMQQMVTHRRIVERDAPAELFAGSPLIAKSPSMMRLLEIAARAAPFDSTILLRGESGTGKELLARFIHDHSKRREQLFVALNCAAIPEELLESELFGHEAGAFTGATQQRKGIFEVASEGTLFLDEVGDLPAPLQAKLLRVLQEGEIRRLGGDKTIRVAPRIIAATNRDLVTLRQNGEFREDLYYRLAVIELEIPPLRARAEDLGALSDHFLRFFCKKMQKPGLEFNEDAWAFINQYSWPGNVRELENVIQRAVLLAGDYIGPEHLGINIQLNMSAIDEARSSLHDIAEKAMRSAEYDAILNALESSHGNKAAAARKLGVSYKTLLSKIKQIEQDERVGA